MPYTEGILIFKINCFESWIPLKVCMYVWLHAALHHVLYIVFMMSLMQYEESLSGRTENIIIKTNNIEGNGTIPLCQICYDKKIDCIFLPCGHARTCERCATKIKNSGKPCPYCRKGVSTTYRIYLWFLFFYCLFYFLLFFI